MTSTLVLEDASKKLKITASFQQPVTLNTNDGSWSITIQEPSLSPPTSWTFSIPLQVSSPTQPVPVALIRSEQTWATFPWKPTGEAAIITASPLTSPASTSVLTTNPTSVTPPKSTITSTSSAAATPTASLEGLSTGGKVGIGVGSAVALGLLALLVGFSYLRQKSNHQKSDHPKVHPQSPVELTQPPDPQLITKKELRDKAFLLEAAIRRYVDNYLSPGTMTEHGNVDVTSRPDLQLSRLAAQNERWQTLFLDSTTQYSAWRMFIARVLSDRIDRKRATDVTLLPVEALERYQFLVGGRNQQTHYDAWRKLQNDRGLEKYPKDSTPLGAEDARNRAVEEAIQDIQGALLPFRHKQGDEADSEHKSLRGIVVDTALLGWRMFSESQVTEFFWSDSPSSGMEVFPGVRRIRAPHEGGQQEVIRVPSCP